MDVDGPSLFWFLVPGVVVPGALLVLSFGSPTRRQVRRWGATCGVTITTENEPVVRSHLGRSRRFRSVASFPFWWLASVRLVDSDFPAPLATPVVGLAAYLVGALVAELTGPLVAPAGRRSALLSPRLIGDYRPSWLRNLVTALVGVSGVATLVRCTVDDPSGQALRLAVTFGLAIVVVVVSEITARSIVRRPQRGTSPDLLAADDGLRAAAVSTTSGASVLAGIGVAATATTLAVPAEAGGPWNVLLLVWLLALQGAAVGVLLLIVRQETWGYRRRFARSTAGAMV